VGLPSLHVGMESPKGEGLSDDSHDPHLRGSKCASSRRGLVYKPTQTHFGLLLRAKEEITSDTVQH
jgi:hypothetical protein